tara:strand:- start:780 stop:1358 length:579 start_codon:yes stop_codon:yes gene_type:complete
MKNRLHCSLYSSIGLSYFSAMVFDEREVDKPSDFLEDAHLGPHRSFSLGLSDRSSNLWMLAHFKNLKIDKMALYYREYYIRSSNKRKVYPQRRLKKPFANTLDLVNYLSSKKSKLDSLEIKFENGWAIRSDFFSTFEFMTTTTNERDALIHKLIALSGLDPLDLSSLEGDTQYRIDSKGKLTAIDMFEGFKS